MAYDKILGSGDRTSLINVTVYNWKFTQGNETKFIDGSYSKDTYLSGYPPTDNYCIFDFKRPIFLYKFKVDSVSNSTNYDIGFHDVYYSYDGITYHKVRESVLLGERGEEPEINKVLRYLKIVFVLSLIHI